MISRRRIASSLCVAGWVAFIVTIGLTLAGSSAVAEEPAPKQGVSRPNIILIVVDTLRADAITGSRDAMPLMPKLHAFASDSWWFTNAVSQSSWTRPAMASLLTSMYFSVHNVQCGVASKITEGQDMHVDILPQSAGAMACVLKAAGYDTRAIQTNPQLEAQFGFSSGIDGYLYVGPDTKANRVTDLALEALRGAALPCFLYVHYMDPHGPYSPPPPYDHVFGAPPGLTLQDEPLIAGFTDYYHDLVLYEVGVNSKRTMGDLSESGRAYVRYMYDGEVRFIDDEVSRLIHDIRRRFPNSIIVFTADHGEEFWEHGSIGHGKTLFQELIHVPLIINIPGKEAMKYERLVETVDVLPTLAACLGLPFDSRWQGKDLVREVDAPQNERAVFSRTRSGMREARINYQAVMRGNDKLIIDDDAGVERFYDLSADPGEQENRAKRFPGKVAELRGLLAQHEQENAQHAQSRTHEQIELDDPEVLEHLRSIGYLK